MVATTRIRAAIESRDPTSVVATTCIRAAIWSRDPTSVVAATLTRASIESRDPTLVVAAIVSHGARAPSSALAPSPAPHFPRRPRPSPIFCPGTISGYVFSAPPRPSPAFCPNYVFGSADLRRLRVIFCALASTLATRAPHPRLDPRTPAYSSARASPLFRPPAPSSAARTRAAPLSSSPLSPPPPLQRPTPPHPPFPDLHL